MSTNKTIKMTEGSIGKTMLRFILPLIGTSIFQQLYNTTDFLFVGNLLGKTSAAAVGASSTLVTCCIGLFSGIAVGTSVVIAQSIGAGEPDKADKALHSSMVFGIIGGLVLMIFGILFTPSILGLLHTPETVMEQAVLYIRIYFLSLPASILYNMGGGALRACGDSQTPFRILVVCGFINVIGDFLFIQIIPLGVAGVAIATIISQWLSLGMILICLRQDGRPIRLSRKKLTMDREIVKRVLRIGLPSGIQTIVITFSNVMVQYYINGFGETAVAAFATYYKVENFIYLLIMAFGQAATTFSGQNTGAGQFLRIKKGTGMAAGMGAGVTLCIAGAILLFPELVFGWFMKDSDVVASTMTIAMVSFPFYWIYPIMEVTGGALRGMGYSISSMVIILASLCGIRIGLLAVFNRSFHSLSAIAAVYPITWAVAAVSFVILFLIIMRRKNERNR
ncbi:MAG: MATE family efflux transporter [Clostridia bacterium]|nr:MATE family efflux transporter [Clostridia bacterium]